MISEWVQAHGLEVVIIVLVAVVINRFSEMVLVGVIRRTVGRLHTDTSEEDVRKRQDTLIGMFATIVRVLVWFVVGFTILKKMGIDLTPLLAGASVLGVAIGFGAQSLIKDFLAGLFIILENQYRVGDVVDLQGSDGTVEQITIRSTTVRDEEGNVHYIPNGTITKVINKTMDYSNINMTITVPPETDIDKLTEIINDVGDKMAKDEKWKKKVMEPPHFLSIGNFTDKSLDIKIIGKTKASQQWNVSGELRRRLLAALKKNKILASEVTDEK